MYKIILMLLAWALLGFGLMGPALMLHPDFSQMPVISQDNGDDIGGDIVVQKSMSQDVPQVGHEPLPPPPPPPPGEDDYQLADLSVTTPGG
ncbi:MAG: hypothetical protein GXO74_09940 [Calditrichaeota bacterium]|nr:hypothetical protein [Calditrichota bacterium]